MNRETEIAFGKAWKRMALAEGHKATFPPSMRKNVQPKTESVEMRRDKIVGYVRNHPDRLAGQICKSMGIKKDTFSNDVGVLSAEGRLKHRKDLSGNRRYYVEEV